MKIIGEYIKGIIGIAIALISIPIIIKIATYATQMIHSK